MQTQVNIPDNPVLQSIKDNPAIGEVRKKKLKKAYVSEKFIRLTCGHKFNPDRQPAHRNCHQCWMTLFVNNEKLVALTEEGIEEGGLATVRAWQGDKFLKYYKQFVAENV